jgi:K+-sensing histidine kinase KdpD
MLGMNFSSFFASPQRLDPNELETQITNVSKHPILASAMELSQSVLAILNDHRQIIAANMELLKLLGIHDPHELLGMRPGEMLQCQNAHLEPGGCGTSRLCAGCAAGICIVDAIKKGESFTTECSIRTVQHNQHSDLLFDLQIKPLDIEGHVFVLLFMQDRTKQKKQEQLEHAFLHDIRNIVQSLQSGFELLQLEQANNPLIQDLQHVTQRLEQEVQLQATLAAQGISMPTVHPRQVKLAALLDDLRLLFSKHKLCNHKHLCLPTIAPNQDISLFIDDSLVLRVLQNMVLNALEASQAGDTVQVDYSFVDDFLQISVHNPAYMPPEIAGRVFQRHFSTKDVSKSARGLGTWSMKLIGESILKGNVQFESTPQAGTVFTFQFRIR